MLSSTQICVLRGTFRRGSTSSFFGFFPYVFPPSFFDVARAFPFSLFLVCLFSFASPCCLLHRAWIFRSQFFLLFSVQSFAQLSSSGGTHAWHSVFVFGSFFVVVVLWPLSAPAFALPFDAFLLVVVDCLGWLLSRGSPSVMLSFGAGLQGFFSPFPSFYLRLLITAALFFLPALLSLGSFILHSPSMPPLAPALLHSLSRRLPPFSPFPSTFVSSAAFFYPAGSVNVCFPLLASLCSVAFFSLPRPLFSQSVAHRCFFPMYSFLACVFFSTALLPSVVMAFLGVTYRLGTLSL